VTRFFDWLKRWVDDIRSTNLTIVTGLAEGMLFVLWALIADTLGRPLTERTMDTVGLFITGQISAGVVQFGWKRQTDKGLAEAKAAGAEKVAAARQTVSMPAVHP
jgi:hypothetical protein